MTPGARISAVIGVLDRVLAGDAAERALTGWARASRFAGSSDRAAVRDLVFTALRRRRSLAWIGGAATGRGLMIGLAIAEGRDIGALFTGQGHAPGPVTAGEGAGDLALAPGPVRLDCPDWLWPQISADLAGDRDAALSALQHRAPVHLRVNPARGDNAAAIAALAAEGIVARQHASVKTALEVTENASRIRTSAAYAAGLVELQDAASQAAVLRLPLRDGMRVLDFCAGGGGKSLAMAALARLTLVAHDAQPGRMADLPARAARAGARVALADTASLARMAPFDLVLVDAPCSGSGAWRRSPDAKWRLDAAGLAALSALQSRILEQAAGLVGAGGGLAYATCSILTEENAARIAAFRQGQPGWQQAEEMRLLPTPDHDGFYLARLCRKVLATGG